MPDAPLDLAAAARQEMIDHGFAPEFPPAVRQQLASLTCPPDPSLRDLRSLLWSSIDNDDSRDLDQIEWAERTPEGIRVLVGIADVDLCVAQSTPMDAFAAAEATTVYAGIHTFPMLPEELSTGRTSLGEGQDRAALIAEMAVASDGSVTATGIYPALVRNRAQLTYSTIGPWLEGSASPPPKVAAAPDLQAQLKMQDQAAGWLRDARHRLGALSFDRVEAQPVIADGQVRDIVTRQHNRAAELIEDFMIAANETIARTLAGAKVSSIRRVVKAPERWDRIVELGRQYGEQLPPQPDAAALNAFLTRRKQSDPLHYSDISLAVLKLMGPGEYVLLRAGDPALGHFGLAAHDYTHATAPNRRFADLVTQRLLKALAAHAGSPYSDGELDAIARNCTLKEDAARKVERAMNKRLAAAALQHRIGNVFSAVVTGVTPKGVFVRVLHPPVEGRLVRGEHGLDVGDRLDVTLLRADPRTGYIDFGR
jgi:exoribonuclease II